jgi:two-component system, NarL family, response regulator LiaR
MYSNMPHADYRDDASDRRVSVMLVDDDPVFRQMVAALLQTHHQGQLDLVGTASSSEECILQAQVLTPEVVLMDLSASGRVGMWAIPLLQILFPETRIIALTHNDGADSRSAILAAGGTDLVSKTAWKTDLIPTIRRAAKMFDLEPSFTLES